MRNVSASRLATSVFSCKTYSTQQPDTGKSFRKMERGSLGRVVAHAPAANAIHPMVTVKQCEKTHERMHPLFVKSGLEVKKPS